jgi:thiol-disulfide isomerase/thioredoxin
MWIYLKYLAGILALLVVTFIGYVLYGRFFSRVHCAPSESTAIQSSSESTPELMFFYASWCGHCKTAKPEWESTKEYLHTNPVKSHRVFCVEYDCSEKTPETEQILNQYKIDGFPTIKLKYENTIYDFNEIPTKENLLIFINTTLQ